MIKEIEKIVHFRHAMTFVWEPQKYKYHVFQIEHNFKLDNQRQMFVLPWFGVLVGIRIKCVPLHFCIFLETSTDIIIFVNDSSYNHRKENISTLAMSLFSISEL